MKRWHFGISGSDPSNSPVDRGIKIDIYLNSAASLIVCPPAAAAAGKRIGRQIKY